MYLDHNEFSLLLELIEIMEEDLSEYSIGCLRSMGGYRGKHKAKKLSSHFKPRENYVMHGMMLKLCMELGLELVKVTRGVKFRQDKFMKPFMDKCIEQRMKSFTKFEQMLWKILGNAVFGKTIENGDGRLDVRFIVDRALAVASQSNPRFRFFTPVSEEMTLHHLKPKMVDMRRPWPVGVSILELSKYAMAKLYYYDLKPKLNCKVSILMSDTDSFFLAVLGKGRDEALKSIAHVMDFSNLDPSHELYDESRKRRPGYLKLEEARDIRSFVGLRSKTYSFLVKGEKRDEQSTRCKGVKSSVQKRIPYEAYVACIESVCRLEITQYNLQAKNHVNRLVRSDRVAFSSFDDKRYLLCPIHSCPRGSMVEILHKTTGRCWGCLQEGGLF